VTPGPGSTTPTPGMSLLGSRRPSSLRSSGFADQLAVLGRDAIRAGRGPLHGGGLRTLDLFGGRGFLNFIVAEHLRLVLIVRVTWID
jgi:hypothetical protein